MSVQRFVGPMGINITIAKELGWSLADIEYATTVMGDVSRSITGRVREQNRMPPCGECTFIAGECARCGQAYT